MTAQRELKTDALVVGSMRYGEADRILTLYTRDRGRVSAIAKGVRRPKSKIGGRLEPFSLVRVVLHQGRTLYTVTGAETVRTFQGARDQLFRIQEGSRLLDTIRRLFPEEERNAAAFNLLVRGVAHLAVAGDRAAAVAGGAGDPGQAPAGSGVPARAGRLRPVRCRRGAVRVRPVPGRGAVPRLLRRRRRTTASP